MLELLLEIVVTSTEKQTAQSAMGADTPRDLMERLVQLEEESTRMQTTLRRKERSLSNNELLGKSNVVTRNREKEKPFIVEAYSAAGMTEFAHGMKRKMVEQHEFLALMERERHTVHSESLPHAAHVDKWKSLSLGAGWRTRKRAGSWAHSCMRLRSQNT